MQITKVLRLSAARPGVEEAQFAEFDVGNDHWFDLIALQPIADYPHCRMTWFEDPEGNNVSLHQMLE